MALVLLKLVDSAGAGPTTTQKVFYEVTFCGADVPEEVAIGLKPQIEVDLAEDYGLSDMKSAIIVAAQAKAFDLGLIVAVSDINLPSYETG